MRLSHLQHIYRPSAAALGRFCIKTKYADIYKDNSTDKMFNYKKRLILQLNNDIMHQTEQNKRILKNKRYLHEL